MKKQSTQNTNLNWAKFCLSFLLLVTSFTAKAVDYYWVGGASATFGAIGTLATSVGGTGNVSAYTGMNTAGNTDVFYFDASDISSTAGSQTGAVTVTLPSNADTYYGQIIVRNGSNTNSFTFTASGTRRLNIVGGTGIDFQILGTSALLTTGSSISINLPTGTTGEVNGSLTLGAGANAHFITGVDASSWKFKSGSTCNAAHGAGAPFGQSGSSPVGNNNSILFENGSTYVHNSTSGNPFQATAPSSYVVFQTGSTYRQDANVAPSLVGRTYANFVWNNTGTQTLTGSTASVTFDSIAVTAAGVLNLNLTGGIYIKGSIRVAAGTLAFSPSSANNLYFSGTVAQGVLNSSTLTFGSNSTIIDTNSTANVTFSSAVTTSGPVRVAPGCVLATAATHTGTGGVTVNGSYQLNSGGYATGTFTYGSGGTLIYNASTQYGTAGSHTYWPTSSGPVNVTILSGGGLNLGSGGQANRTVSGVFRTAANVTQSNSSALTITGTCQIDSLGSFSFAPTYSGTPTLIYNTGAAYTISNEWSGAGPTVTAGVPRNVTVQKTGTTLTVNAARNIGGTFTVNSGCSAIVSNTLTVPGGSTSIAGSLQLNSGGSMANQVTYSGVSSNLIYNSSFTIGNEWNGTSNSVGAGVPQSVFVQNSSTVTIPASNNRSLSGYLSIGSGSTLALASIYTGTDSCFGTLQLNSGGSVASAPIYSGNSSTLNYNGGSSISVSNSNVEWNSSSSTVGAGVPRNVTISGSNTIVRLTVAKALGGTLAVNSVSGVILDNTYTGASSIAGTLTLNSGGSVATAPTYSGTASTLTYNQGGSFTTSTEWNSTSASVGSGVPQNVIIQNSSSVGFAANRALTGTLTVETGSTCLLSGTGSYTAGSTFIKGTLQINSGGFITPTATYNGTSSALIYNSGGTYANANEWNGAGPGVGSGVPQNVTVQNNSTLTTSANRSLTGTLTVASGSTIGLAAGYTAGSTSIAGTMRIDAGGYCTPNAVYSGSSSALVYNSAHAQGTPYGIGGEWPSSNMPTSITIQNNTSVGLSTRTYNGSIAIGSGSSLRSNSGDNTLTLSGGTIATPATFNNSGTMFGEYGGNTMNIIVSGVVSLGGSTGFIDARNTTVNGTLITNGNGIQSNSGTGTFTLGAGATITTDDVDGVYDGATNNTMLRYNSGTLTAGNITLNGTSTVEYNRAAGGQSVSALSYGKLKLSNTSGTQTAAGNITVADSLFVVGGGTFNMGTNTLSGSGLTPNGSGTINTQNTSGTPIPTGKIWTQTIVYNSSSAQTIVNGTYGSLTASGGNRTLSGTINVSGVFTPGSGTYTPSSSTFNYTGTSQTVGAISYNNLSLAGATSPSLPNGTVAIAGTFNHGSLTGSTVGTINFNGASQTINVLNYNNLDLTGASSTSFPSGIVGIKGVFTPASITSAGGVGTVSFNNSTGGQSVPAFTYNNLTMANTSGTQTASGAVACNGTLTVSSGGTLDMATNALSGTLTPSGSGTIKTQNTGSTPIPTGKTWTQTIDYSSASNQTIVAGTYAALTASTGGTKTMAADITVSGALTLSSAKAAINGNTLTLNGTVSGMSASNSLVGSNASKLTVGATGSVGTIFFDRSISADVNTLDGSNALQNLLVTSGGNITLGNRLNLFERLSVTNGTFNTGDSLVLRSIAGTSSNNTAYVDSVGGTINGQVIVEKYIHKQFRGWRALTAPITYNGITQGYVSANWQSNWGYAANYGTKITGPTVANGIDEFSIGNSLQTFNSSNNSWTKINNTNTETMAGSTSNAANKAFYIFIRGDRTVGNAGTSPNAYVSTTLAARGKLQTGTQTFNYTGAANTSWLVGNPYACPVDMSTITYDSIGSYVYVWDPNLSGSSPNTCGQYVIFDRSSNWANPAPSAGSSTKYFQSGQAFFVKPTVGTGGGARLIFNEVNKAPSSQNNQVTRTNNQTTDVFNVKLLHVKADGTKSEVDGFRAKFGASYSADVDANDAPKFAASGIESLGLKRNNKTLSIEARPYIALTDSLFVTVGNLSAGANYEFKINTINFDASISSCKIIDRFLNTETPVNLSATTNFGFNVSSVAGSADAGRFIIVFNATGSLSTASLNIRASKQNNKVVIDWENTNEIGVHEYQIEKSVDGRNFSKLETKAATNNSTLRKYSIVDNDPVNNTINYYRIKTILSSNKFNYSNVVVVNFNTNVQSGISVYPNPVRGSSIGIVLNSIAAGEYTANLVDLNGNIIANNKLTHSGNTGTITLQLGNTAIAAGNYLLVLKGSDGKMFTEKVYVAD